MDKVILLKKHLTDITVKSKQSGRWEKGKRIEEKEITKIIKGVCLPVSGEILRYYPQGAISINDLELFTKDDLADQDVVVIKTKEYEIFQKSDFYPVADIKTYILKRSTKDD